MADATNGPSDATLVTPVSVTLPTAANNQPVVQLRVITADANGPDEWVGIDDIAVTGVPPDTAPTVAATTPTDGAVDVPVDSNVQVTFSEPVDVANSWFDISCDSSGTHTATVSGGPTTFTLDPGDDFAPSEPCTLTIVASDVTDQDTNDPPDAMATNAIVTFTTAAPPDEAPTVTSTTPADTAADVAVDSNLSVTFSEPVDVADGWFELACDTSGAHPAAVTGGPDDLHDRSDHGLRDGRGMQPGHPPLARHGPGHQRPAGHHGQRRDGLVHDRRATGRRPERRSHDAERRRR